MCFLKLLLVNDVFIRFLISFSAHGSFIKCFDASSYTSNPTWNTSYSNLFSLAGAYSENTLDDG